MKQVANQQEFNDAVAAGDRELYVVGDCTIVVTSADEICLVVSGSSQPRVEAWGSSQPRVVARESSQPRVVAWGSSQPRVEAWGSSQPRVVAWGSSQPRVEAWGSSQPRVVAWGSSQPRVVAWGSSQPRVEARESSRGEVKADGYVQLSISGTLTVTAGPMVSVLVEGDASVVTGGHVVTMPARTTAEAWLSYYGVPVVDGVATLFKAVRGNYASAHDPDFMWTPGTMPKVARMDTRECGTGLHACAHPKMGLQFYSAEDVRFIACPVKVADIRVAKDPEYPNKVKFKSVCAPVYEVNEDGERMAVTTAAPAAGAR